MKTFFSLIVILSFLPGISAAQDTLVFYWDKNGRQVEEVGSADIIQKITPVPGSTELYQVREYNHQGLLQLEGTVSEYKPRLHFEDLVRRFDKKGGLASEINYKDNKYEGEAKFYYKNGQLREVVEHYHAPNPMNPHGSSEVHVKMVAYFDSLGNQQVKDGNGFAIVKTDAFTEKGRYSDGVKDSIWTGVSSKSDFSYIEKFDKGKFVSGESVSDGQKFVYNQQEIQPEYPGGIMQFYQYIGRNYKYPAEARKKGVSGTVIVSFVVEKDGSLTDLKTLRDLGMGTGEEALRVVKNSPSWIPGKQHGVPVRVQYTLPIRLNLSR
ncbi:energy transducer TonB [Pedobacter sp. SYSU D00535]|uniref:energy transducer TonB n=1 Tax=Pedobacter sp. SYSU D00535 TaxID=2810308 RepID=UPI001F625952|nr:energy transducer TonB [Pedobacter sp. SYSU D00535]